MTPDDDDRRADGTDELTTRDVVGLLVNDLTVRPYAIAAAAAVAMIFLVMLATGDMIGGVLIALFATAGLVLRWVAAPVFVLLMVTYFSLFPGGVPVGAYENYYRMNETYFRPVDVVLVLAVTVYVICFFRIYGLVQQAIPFENVLRRKGDKPVRRPVAHIAPGEVGWLVGAAVAFVVFGQVAWWLSNSLEFAPGDDFSLYWAEERPREVYVRSREPAPPPGQFTPGQNRFIVMLGALFFGTLLTRTVFGYWRLRAMNAAEGAMILTDTSWADSHRERVRVEQKRIWGKQRAAELAQKAERAEKARRRREEERERARAAARAREGEPGGPRRRRRPRTEERDE